jgi:hypothetical protein
VLTYLIAFTGVAVLVFLWRRDQANSARRRGAFFEDCLDTLDSAQLKPGALGYPILTGRWHGHPVTAEPVVDTLGVRKLPSLWLKLTVEMPVATGACLDLMMRPLGSEFFSPFDTFAHRIDTPAAWPERAVLRTNEPSRLPPLHLLDPEVGVFHRPEAKELLITPRGVRLVWQADEAVRSDFLLLRQARFAKERLDPQVLGDLIARCVSIRDRFDECLRREAAE